MTINLLSTHLHQPTFQAKLRAGQSLNLNSTNATEKGAKSNLQNRMNSKTTEAANSGLTINWRLIEVEKQSTTGAFGVKRTMYKASVSGVVSSR